MWVMKSWEFLFVSFLKPIFPIIRVKSEWWAIYTWCNLESTEIILASSQGSYNFDSP